MNKIALFIKTKRKEAGLTQEEFAMRSGPVSYTHLAKTVPYAVALADIKVGCERIPVDRLFYELYCLLYTSQRALQS